jgi:hypothetical protein
MSTPIPAPGNGQPATTTGYTHRTWLDEMADALGHIAGVYRDLTVMKATLTQVGAGRTQMALVEAGEATGMDIMRTGVGFVDATDRRYMPVFEAIQKAGGQAEVAQDKRYHNRD